MLFMIKKMTIFLIFLFDLPNLNLVDNIYHKHLFLFKQTSFREFFSSFLTVILINIYCKNAL